jgi:hypothetical protein
VNDKPLIPKGSLISHKSNALWEERWTRFSQGLLSRGIDEVKHDFFRNWARIE